MLASEHNLCDQQKPQIGYKDLMKGYHNKVSTLAGSKQKTEVSLVVNLFQSVLDGFIRGEIKRVESEPTRVSLRIQFQSSVSKVHEEYKLSGDLLIFHFRLLSGHQDRKEEEEEKGQMCKFFIFTCIVNLYMQTDHSNDLSAHLLSTA